MASVNQKTPRSCIDEMEALLDQINEFKRTYPSSKKANPQFNQEYRLFQQHIKWVSEDLIKPVQYNVRNR